MRGWGKKAKSYGECVCGAHQKCFSEEPYAKEEERN